MLDEIKARREEYPGENGYEPWDMAMHIDYLLARIERLETALRWYADASHYESRRLPFYRYAMTVDMEQDAGERARAALEG